MPGAESASIREERRLRPLTFLGFVLVFGALWGAAQGMWFLAPGLVHVHRVIPTCTSQWVVLEASLLLVSAGFGTLLGLLGAFLMVAWGILRRRPYRDLAWATGVALGLVLPLGYLGSAEIIEWKYFGRVSYAHDWRLAVGVIAYVLGGSALVVAYRRVMERDVPPSAHRLGAILTAIAALGAAALPLHVRGLIAATTVDGGPLVPAPKGNSAATPVVLVGIDSANWETIRPLVERGALPTISRLIAEGMHGDVAALWPPFWSSAAWAAILTGHPREETGIYADLTVHAPGLPPFDAPLDGNVLFDPYFLVEWLLLGRGVMQATHPSRSVLHRPPVWELLSHAGVETGVIRFDFTFPADDQASIVVSNAIGHDNWDLAQVRQGEGIGLVSPQSLRDELSAPFSDDQPFDERLFAALLPGPSRPRSPHVELEIRMLRRSLDIDNRTFAAGERVLRLRPGLRFLALYFPGFDEVCHAFWAYRFPEAYGDMRPSAADVAEFHDVIDGYLEFLDRGLARLLATYPSPPNVIILSDHGHEAVMDHPLWRGWHSRRGVFIAEGPAFPRRRDTLAVSYYDLVPTIADVLGFDLPEGMHGSSVVPRDQGPSTTRAGGGAYAQPGRR